MQALFEIARAIDEGQDGHVLKRFWSAFIRRFGTNLATGAIFLAFYGLIGFDMWYTSSQSVNSDMNAINYGVCASIGIIGAIGTAYVLPLASRSSRSVSQQLKCSAALVAVHPPAGPHHRRADGDTCGCRRMGARRIVLRRILLGTAVCRVQRLA